MSFLNPLKGHSKTIFFTAALILILNNIAAAMNAFTDMASLGAAMKEVLQVLGYGSAFVGGLALFVTLEEEGIWPARASLGRMPLPLSYLS